MSIMAMVLIGICGVEFLALLALAVATRNKPVPVVPKLPLRSGPKLVAIREPGETPRKPAGETPALQGADPVLSNNRAVLAHLRDALQGD